MAKHNRRIGDHTGGPTTFVSAATRFVGSITGSGPYVFCGTVDGDCEIDGSVTLAAGGRWTGTIRAIDVVVAGDVNGDVVASNRVEISATARIFGSLSGHSIAIARGAVIEGDVAVASGLEPFLFDEKRA